MYIAIIDTFLLESPESTISAENNYNFSNINYFSPLSAHFNFTRT